MLQPFFGAGGVEVPCDDDDVLAAVASEATHVLQSYSTVLSPPSGDGRVLLHFDALHVPG